MARVALIIADRDGNTLGRVPDAAGWAGRPVPAWLRPLINREHQGVETIVDPYGHTVIAAYVPNTSPGTGIPGTSPGTGVPDTSPGTGVSDTSPGTGVTNTSPGTGLTVIDALVLPAT